MRDRDIEDMGSDLEQIIAMLERSEIDYVEDSDGDMDDPIIIVDVNETVRMSFDEDGNLIKISPIPH